MFALPVIQMFTFFIDNKTDIVYCLISLFAESFAENVINKAFNKHAVVSFTGTWVETHNDQAPGDNDIVVSFTGTWVETCNVGKLEITNIGRILYGYVG